MDSVFMIAVLKALFVAPASGRCGLRIATCVWIVCMLRSDASRVVWGVHPMSREGSGSLSEAFSRRNCVKIFPGVHSRSRRKRSAFVLTETELRLIAAPASMGLSSRPKKGIEQASGDGNAEGVVSEGKEEIQADGFGNAAQVTFEERDACALHRHIGARAPGDAYIGLGGCGASFTPSPAIAMCSPAS